MQEKTSPTWNHLTTKSHISPCLSNSSKLAKFTSLTQPSVRQLSTSLNSSKTKMPNNKTWRSAYNKLKRRCLMIMPVKLGKRNSTREPSWYYRYLSKINTTWNSFSSGLHMDGSGLFWANSLRIKRHKRSLILFLRACCTYLKYKKNLSYNLLS